MVFNLKLHMKMHTINSLCLPNEDLADPPGKEVKQTKLIT